jgi:hypothetical protein
MVGSVPLTSEAEQPSAIEPGLGWTESPIITEPGYCTVRQNVRSRARISQCRLLNLCFLAFWELINLDQQNGAPLWASPIWAIPPLIALHPNRNTIEVNNRLARLLS